MSANPEIKELKGQIESLKNSLIEAKEENHKLSEELDKSKPSWSGTWEMDLLTKQVSWSNEMYLILGLDSSIDPDMASFLLPLAQNLFSSKQLLLLKKGHPTP